MLKKRIKKWDLDRNHKQTDMLYSVKLALERESQGKKTAFVIRGRVVTFEQVKHYSQKKGVRDLKALVQDTDIPLPKTRIDCKTPEPFDIAADDGNQPSPDIEMANESPGTRVHPSRSGIGVIPDPNQMGSMLKLDPELDRLQQLLHHGRDCYTSIFEGRDWKKSPEGFRAQSAGDFLSQFVRRPFLPEYGRNKCCI